MIDQRQFVAYNLGQLAQLDVAFWRLEMLRGVFVSLNELC